MKKRTNRIFQLLTKTLLSLFVFVPLISFANGPEPLPTSNPIPTSTALLAPALIIPSAPRIDAKAYVLMDASSGVILAEKNMNARLLPASLTKLMTLYVTSQALAQGQIHLNDTVRVSEAAWSRGGSRMFLKEGSTPTLQELIDGIIVASGNDACVATAEYVGGSEDSFTDIMNQTAQRLGMKDSHFTDSNGLPHPDHYSTAHDLAILTRALITHFPQYYGFYKQKWLKYNNIRQPNRNRLLWRDPSVDGLKTGHTQEAGYCLIASALRSNMRLISVVMGEPTDSGRSNDSQALLNWGFRYYHTYKLFNANTSISNARVWLGEKKNIQLGLNRDFYITAPIGNSSIKTAINIPTKLRAPIVKGQVYGSVDIYLKEKVIATAPLIALENDSRAGMFSRGIDHIGLFFKKIF